MFVKIPTLQCNKSKSCIQNSTQLRQQGIDPKIYLNHKKIHGYLPPLECQITYITLFTSIMIIINGTWMCNKCIIGVITMYASVFACGHLLHCIQVLVVPVHQHSHQSSDWVCKDCAWWTSWLFWQLCGICQGGTTCHVTFHLAGCFRQVLCMFAHCQTVMA